jgi:1,3,6,8-tetrahydroxynaphthalene synthase
MQAMAASQGWYAGDLEFYIVHVSGPRILNDLSKFLCVKSDAFRYSRATLTEYGNIASAVVLDALARLFADGGVDVGATGIIAGFGPGITAEMTLGT